MAIYDPKQMQVLINGVEVDDYADGADVIKAVQNAEAGAWTIGADGGGVFVADANESATFTLKLRQHGETNKTLSELYRKQKKSLKGFTPLRVTIRDLINEDVVTGEMGYFTAAPEFIRGAGHNATTWTIVCLKSDFKLEAGI